MDALSANIINPPTDVVVRVLALQTHSYTSTIDTLDTLWATLRNREKQTHRQRQWKREVSSERMMGGAQVSMAIGVGKGTGAWALTKSGASNRVFKIFWGNHSMTLFAVSMLVWYYQIN